MPWTDVAGVTRHGERFDLHCRNGATVQLTRYIHGGEELGPLLASKVPTSVGPVSSPDATA